MERVSEGSVAMEWLEDIERMRVSKGSVAMAWIEKHGEDVYVKRFCNGGVASETWRCISSQKVLASKNRLIFTGARTLRTFRTLSTLYRK